MRPMRTTRPSSWLLVLCASASVLAAGACAKKRDSTALTDERTSLPGRPGHGPVEQSPAQPPPVSGVTLGCDSTARASREVAAPRLVRTLPGSWEEGWLASPTLIDLDGDGRKDIVAPRHGMLYAWRHDGTLLWRTAFGHSANASPSTGGQRIWASAAAADVNGDGALELVVASDLRTESGGNVAAYDLRGNLLPGWPARFGDTEIRSITAADVTGDGLADVLVNKLHDGPSTALFGGDGRMHPGWPQVSAACHEASRKPCLDYGGYNQNVGAADLDGDGTKDVVTTYDLMAFGIFKGTGQPFPAAEGFSDDVVTGIEAYHDLSLAQQGWGVGDRSEFTDSPPVLVDLDGDGKREVVLLGHHEHSESTTQRGFTLWALRPDGSRPEGWAWPKDLGPPLRTEWDGPGHNIIVQLPSLVAADLDPRAGTELLFPSSDGFLYAYDARGEQLWRRQLGNGHPFVGISEPAVVDLNADGSPEVVFTTWSEGTPGQPKTTAHLFVLAADGEELHRVPLFGRGAMAAPSVADLDGDGALEVVLSLKDALGDGQSGVQIWTVPGSDGRCMPWPTGRANVARTGAP